MLTTMKVASRPSRAIWSSPMYHVFLISLLQCIVVIMCPITMATQSSDGASTTGIFNASTDQDIKYEKPLEVCPFIYTVPCPPHNSLQLVCNKSVGDRCLTCVDRVFVIEECLQIYPNLYNNSNWNQCLEASDCVDKFKVVLHRYGFIKNGSDGDTETDITITTSSTEPSVTSPTVSSTKSAIFSTVSSTKFSAIVSSVSSTEDFFTGVSVNTTTRPGTRTISTKSQGYTSTPLYTSSYNISIEKMGSSTSDGDFPPISYVYPIIGAFIIACEIVLLCLFSCYKKKREGQNAAGSLVQQEEVIEPETASPTKAALHPNSVLDDDTVFSEDKKIYKSYINLKYIDDTSAESTPEKSLLRT